MSLIDIAKLKTIRLGVLAALILQGCSLAPVYKRPAAPIDAAWPQGEAYKADILAGSAADIGWKSFFKDTDLQALIGTALDNNRDLRVAALNVQAYQAQYRIQRSDLFPSVDAAASGSRQRLPSDLSPTGAAGNGRDRKSKRLNSN